MREDTSQLGGDGCTLPTLKRPLRVQEFHHLFTHALRKLTRSTPTRMELRLDPNFEDATRDLVARESACCAFFDFRIGNSGDDLVLDIGVPSTQAAMLDAIASLAAAALKEPA